jgi:hypothetical protein
VVLVVGPDIHTAERIALAAASEPFLTQGSFRASTPTIALAPPVLILSRSRPKPRARDNPRLVQFALKVLLKLRCAISWRSLQRKANVRLLKITRAGRATLLWCRRGLILMRR